MNNLPVTLSEEDIFEAFTGTWGNGIVKMTPALVPTHSRSLQANNEVIRKHAALCWRIMSSQPEKIINRF